MVNFRQPAGALTPAQRQAITPFQARVYDALMEVEKGHVTTYKALGSAIECKSSQAIGQALKRNPFAPAVPCHRVIKTDLTLGGFNGTFAKASNKKVLLEEEGVAFQQNSKGDWEVDPACLHQFD